MRVTELNGQSRPCPRPKPMQPWTGDARPTKVVERVVIEPCPTEGFYREVSWKALWGLWSSETRA